MDTYGASQELYTGSLPYNLEAEQSVLGAVLLDASCLMRVMEYVKADSFYRQEHRHIFGIMVRMFTSGSTLDFITVLDEVADEEVFESREAAKVYLTQITQLVPSVSNIEAYARIVQEKYYIRCLMTASKEIIDSCADGMGDARMLLDNAEQRIYEIRQGRDSKGLRRIDEVIVETYDRLQKLTGEDRELYRGLTTGFKDLDNVITGLNKSDFLLVAGRPGMGKTSFCLNVAYNAAKASAKKVVIFSLEMSCEQLVSRMLASEASIGSYALKTGNLTGEEWNRLAMSADILAKCPIYIDDATGITVAEMKARLRRVKDLGLVVIDYLQLMTTGRKNDNRVQEISEITRNLKIMAKELNVPVLTCSQLSRGPDSRTDHRPVLSDLRESGSIEQDADIVMFLYREAYYDRDSDEQNVAECIVAKNRHGETDAVKLAWDGQYTRFSSLEMIHDEPF